MRDRERVREEGVDRDADVGLVQAVEELEGLRKWEVDELEAASVRVFRNRRALLEPQRDKLEEILKRRRGMDEKAAYS